MSDPNAKSKGARTLTATPSWPRLMTTSMGLQRVTAPAHTSARVTKSHSAANSALLCKSQLPLGDAGLPTSCEIGDIAPKRMVRWGHGLMCRVLGAGLPRCAYYDAAPFVKVAAS